MTGEMIPKLRLVRCPKCKQVLPELPNIPVYECGGCGTVLQAKHRKTETRDTKFDHNESDENGKGETDHIPEQGKISCLDQASSPSNGRSSAEARTSSSDKFQGCNIKQPGERSYSEEFPVSSELISCHENGDFSQELGKQMEQDKHTGTSDEDTGEGKHESGDCCSQWQRARSFSDDFRSSMELTCNEREDSSPEFQSCSQDKDAHTFDHCIRMDKKVHGDCKLEQDKGNNFCDEISTTEDKREENDLSLTLGARGEEGKSVVNLSIQDCISVKCKVPENTDCCRESSSFTASDCGEHEKPTTLEAKKEVDENLKDHSAESLKVEDNLDKHEIGSIYHGETAPVENILMENSLSLDNQHLEKNIIPQGFDRKSSVDSFDKLPVDSASSVFGMKQTDFSKSSMARNYYSYDGSVSSFDGYEDQLPAQFSKHSRRKFKHSAFTNSNGMHRQDDSRAKDFQMNKSEMRYQAIRGSRTHDVLSSEPEIRQQARKSLILDENNGYGIKRRPNKLDDLPESRSYGHPGASRSRVDKEDHASVLSFIPRYFPSGQRNGTPSNYQHLMFQHYSGSFSPDMPSYSEPDKEELLRMVYELKEELKRTHISKGRYFTGFTGEEIHAPLHYNHPAPSEEICADLCYPKCLGRTGLPQPHKISRMAFSGDASEYRHQVDCSCLRGCPQDWHCSAQLPSQMMCCNKAHGLGHTAQTCYKGSYSASSSPQHFKTSQFSMYGRETKSDDQSLRDTEMKRHVREKYYSAKRHLMPVAGGIPILACYHCSELLQLPADFLLFGRRYHRLRCNACRKVMKFSLVSGTHLSPKGHNTVAPPPSMVDDCDDSIDRRELVAASHSSKHPHAEPLSCSDDYGMSFDRSCSTEGEPSLMMPAIYPLESNTQNSNTLPGRGSSFQPLEDRKMKSVLVESRETLKNSKENLGSQGPSSKMSKWGKSTSEIEELPPASGSPLHRLMGYLSPSEVIKP